MAEGGSESWVLGVAVKSLHPDSATMYESGQVRVCDIGLRLQGRRKIGVALKEWEDTVPKVSEKLRVWLGSTVSHSCESIAGSGTKYAPAQFRRDESGPYAVRVQIPGPEFNRPWGAEFVLPLAPGVAAKLAKLPEPASTGAPVHYPGADVPIPSGKPKYTGGPVYTVKNPLTPGEFVILPILENGTLDYTGKPTPVIYAIKFGVSNPSATNPTCVDCGHPWGMHFNHVCPVEAVAAVLGKLKDYGGGKADGWSKFGVHPAKLLEALKDSSSGTGPICGHCGKGYWSGHSGWICDTP